MNYLLGMVTVIHEFVEKAQKGENPFVIAKLETCWVVATEQPLTRGHCMTLADPVVFSVNDLSEELRMKYFRDVCRVGDALIEINGAYRINYETLCNVAQALHSHIIPRYNDEPEAKRKERAAVAYPSNEIKNFDPARDAKFISEMKKHLARHS